MCSEWHERYKALAIRNTAWQDLHVKNCRTAKENQRMLLAEIDELEATISQLEEENAQLKAEVAKLQQKGGQATPPQPSHSNVREVRTVLTVPRTRPAGETMPAGEQGNLPRQMDRSGGHTDWCWIVEGLRGLLTGWGSGP
ncbi:unnamed protein product [Vitrella brassicaformis CCMP3155]|uniref:Uncharacterized protein n=1 Tax=Vitrella brassicaformis (strain CCMP3155) TaxID=1169540 RepID=A0A0G4GGE4_VITBC|nr:unnamed protein product [Vitrella brassicaformis CCMP3155]|eukprot:CEM28694.1 unnamed protein product [Vitrella brassicaformis CCMP3155]